MDIRRWKINWNIFPALTLLLAAEDLEVSTMQRYTPFTESNRTMLFAGRSLIRLSTFVVKSPSRKKGLLVKRIDLLLLYLTTTWYMRLDAC